MSSAPSAQSMNHSKAAFHPLFSHHRVVCWADHLIHPTSLSGDPESVRSLGSVPHNLNYQVSGRLQEELWLGVGKEWHLCCNSNCSCWLWWDTGMPETGAAWGSLKWLFSRITSGKYLDFPSCADPGDFQSCLSEAWCFQSEFSPAKEQVQRAKSQANHRQKQ